MLKLKKTPNLKPPKTKLNLPPKFKKKPKFKKNKKLLWKIEPKSIKLELFPTLKLPPKLL